MKDPLLVGLLMVAVLFFVVAVAVVGELQGLHDGRHEGFKRACDQVQRRTVSVDGSLRCLPPDQAEALEVGR